MAATIASMVRSDWPAVRAIYEEGIATGKATFETESPDWPAWNRAHRADCRLVARLDGDVVGWAALTPYSPRPVYAGVAEVSVYVADRARARGVGRALLEAVVAASEEAGVWTLQAGVLAENEASIRLHTAAGFRVVGLRDRLGVHHGVWRDVVLLERRSPVVGADGT